METIAELLKLFGITPDKYPFLVQGILVVVAAAYLRLSSGRTLGKVKDNVLIVIAHLSTAASRGKLDTNLIQVMSPMTVTENGLNVLKDSGFKEIMDDVGHRSEIMAVVADKEPKTKLDVESYAIVSFATLLGKDCMKPVKTYLYNNPSMREIFPTLAGIYIRDEYLKDHPGITD